MTTIDSPVTERPARRQNNVSISYGKDQGIIVNNDCNISDKGEDSCSSETETGGERKGDGGSP